MKKYIFILMLLAVFGLVVYLLLKPVLKQEAEISESPPDDWFFMQRAYPAGRINHEAYLMALKQGRDARMQLRDDRERKSWQLGGPVNIGGRISAVAMHASDITTIFIGVASGGVFKTSDGGLSWIPVLDDALSLSIGDVAIAPSDPAVVYVGTGEANCGGGSMTYDGVGIYKSVDAGASWSYCGLENSRNVGRIVIDPFNPDRVYVAAMGDLFSDNPDRGVFRSLDGGLIWDNVLYVNDSTGAIDIVIHPENTDTLYAAMWERVRRPNRRSYGGPGCGIYRTYDGGDSWQLLSSGLPSGSDVGRIGIGLSISEPNILYAIYADKTGYFEGIFKTINYGDSWTEVNDASLSGMYSSYGWWFGRIRVDPADADIVYGIGFDLYKTSNGGNSWSNVSGYTVHVDQHDLVAHPQNSNYLVLGNDGGIYKSINGGSSWMHLENLPVTQFYTCEVDNQFPQRLYGGTQDNGILRTMTGSTHDWVDIFGGDGFFVLVDPQNNNYVYAESQYGAFGRSTNGGYSFIGATTGINSSDRSNWSTPVVFNPLNPKSLYIGTNKLYKSVNRAVNWQAISGDLTSGPGIGSVVYGTITTISVSPVDTNVIYVGTDDSHVWMTTNSGSNWNDVSAGLPQRWVTRVAADLFNSQTAYATISGYRYDEYLPHVFRTGDNGITWQDISSGLPEAPVNDIIIDPLDHATLYVANDVGVFVTHSLGYSWQVLGDSLPNVPVVDLTLHQPSRKLIAATYGRSMYTIDLGDSIVSVNDQIQTIGPNLFDIYPNPVSDKLYVKTNNLTDKSVYEIYSFAGEMVLSGAILPSVINTLNTSALPQGSYLMRLSNGKNMDSKVFIRIQ